MAVKSVGSVVSFELLFPPPLFSPSLFSIPESKPFPSDEHATAKTEKNINKCI